MKVDYAWLRCARQVEASSFGCLSTTGRGGWQNSYDPSCRTGLPLSHPMDQIQAISGRDTRVASLSYVYDYSQALIDCRSEFNT
jgi:hypothetical protein